MSRIRTPQFFGDLFQDLRDRRLLIPAALLLAALLAVPFLLSTSTEAPPPPPVSPSAVALEEATEVDPAVLAENVTVRDYRKRLDELKSTNPFESPPAPFEAAAEALEGLDELAPSPTAVPGAASGLDAGSVSIGGGDAGSTTSNTSLSGTSTSTGSGGGGGGGDSPEVRYVTRVIDLKIGELGDVQQRRGIGQLTLLPSEAKPVVVFLGTNDGGKKAVFLVSDDVAATAGDGACIPSPADCEYLTMRQGDSRTFDYTPDGQTYKLVLQEIRDVRLDKAPDTEAP